MRLPGLRALLNLSGMTQYDLMEAIAVYKVREFPIEGRAYMCFHKV